MDDNLGLRSVVGTLLSHVRDYGVPEADTPEYADFLDKWCDRLLKTTGYYREQERSKNLPPDHPHEPLGPGSASTLPGPSPRPFERTRGPRSLLPRVSGFRPLAHARPTTIAPGPGGTR